MLFISGSRNQQGGILMPCHTEDRIRVGRYWHCLLGRPLGGYPGTYHNITNGLAGCAGCMAEHQVFRCDTFLCHFRTAFWLSCTSTAVARRYQSMAAFPGMGLWTCESHPGDWCNGSSVWRAVHSGRVGGRRWGLSSPDLWSFPGDP